MFSVFLQVGIDPVVCACLALLALNAGFVNVVCGTGSWGHYVTGSALAHALFLCRELYRQFRGIFAEDHSGVMLWGYMF